jgi:hypothetical protein
MIRTLRALFLGRLLREKLLLVVFALIGLLWWLSSFSGRAGSFARTAKVTSGDLAEQQLWLNNQVAIEEVGRKTAARLDSAQTLDALRLASEVGVIASQNGLHTTSSGGQTTETSGQFSVHTLEYNANRADWDALKKFCGDLQKRAPYIAIKEFTLVADQSNPALLNLRLRISSVEIVR